MPGTSTHRLRACAKHLHFYFRRRRYGNRNRRNRRRRLARARLHYRRRNGRLVRRRARARFRTFHIRFHRVVTTDWPAANKTPTMVGGGTDMDPPVETPLLWNMDHLQFKLSQFMAISGNQTYQHQPPFRYYKFKKIVVKGTWINFPMQTMENVLGNTALDLDGEDTGRGNVKQSHLDPGLPPGLTGPDPTDPTKAPFIFDPLMDRASKKAFNIKRGFKRIFTPKPQRTESANTPLTHLITRTPWVSVREGFDLPWNGLSLTLRQMKDPLNEENNPPMPQIQYDITAYVQFKEFDYETGHQL
ncbi:capsid protein [Bamboo rat circovirus]|uniref:Capsid protein n=1 Tax=Bamboo rat circovirus TaxID=2305270 RepID=A0A346Q077_9CIRC|nr:capsid protein [Bamboo rat circovirus]